jgi:phosphoglycolate phosphatase-like HAD superfamily hydrolase
MIKAIFRDFDGTIGDTLDLVIEGTNILAKKHHWKNIPSTEVFRTQSMKEVIKNM